MATVRTACTMTLDPSDLEEVQGIFETFIKDVQEKDSGTITYHYYIDDDPLLIHVFEAYESSQAHLDHFANIDQQAVGRLLELVTLSALHYYGEPSAEEQALLAGFGDVKFHRPLAGIDETTARA
jgi:quinol monooxygenase YgiN